MHGCATRRLDRLQARQVAPWPRIFRQALRRKDVSVLDDVRRLGHGWRERANELAEKAKEAVDSNLPIKGGRLFVRAFEMAPYRSEFAIKASEQFLSGGEIEKALEFSRQAVEVAPKSSKAHLAFARSLEASGDHKSAKSQLKLAKSLEPTGARAR